MRIGVDARLISGESGGIEQAIIGLASGLSALTDGSEVYHFLAYADSTEWILPYLGANCRLLTTSSAPRRQAHAKQKFGSLYPLIYWAWHTFSPLLGARTVRPPQSDGTIESADLDLMHFTMQQAFLTRIPTIYEPYDLQYRHLPQLFTPRARLFMNVQYKTFCDQAAMVVAMTTWGKHDLVDKFQLPDSKVQVIPRASPLNAYAQVSAEKLSEVREKYALPNNFIFFPAQTWPHKNHISLLQALAILKSRGIIVPLVSSARLNEFYPTIQKRIKMLQLEDQVKFLGFIEPLDVRCLYHLAKGLIFPSKFEGWGLPITEAFGAGLPVACSNVTSLPAVAGDAALLFDPEQPEQIAEAIYKIWTDDQLRKSLVQRGAKRSELFSWERTACLFRAHYRRLGKVALTEEDRNLLSAPTIV